MRNLPVLIIGAGPTGLMMACELARYGISFRIIDKKPEPTQGSNATWLQTRTLEIFDSLRMIDPFLTAGHKCEAINFYEKGKLLGQLPFNSIRSTYPFILMLPQSQTEKILTEQLTQYKIKIERSLELIDVEQTKNGVVSSIKLANGKLESITTDWLIACDGANSTIRDKCRMKFHGADISEQFMVADAQMSSYLCHNEIHMFFDKGTIFPQKHTIFSAFPWGNDEYRLSANLYFSHPRQSFFPHEVKEVVAERTYGNYIVKNVRWISPFWIHSKIIQRLQEGAIFFAGDAAHIHSPAGGQGMNTGIQDAYNLAWKLALVINGKAKATLLESYQSERLPVVKNIVKQTDALTNMALFHKSFSKTLKTFTGKISKNSQFMNKTAEQLTQVRIRYEKSPIIHYINKSSRKSPQPGERVPDILVTGAKTLYQYLENTKHNILFFVGGNLSKKQMAAAINTACLLNKYFRNSIKAHIIAPSAINKDIETLLDPNAKLQTFFNIEKFAVYVIRPDNCIAYYSNKCDLKDLQKHCSLTED